jgi:GNAT superfamily N-acetyltransferase
MVAIRDLRTEDWDAWKPLWDGYLRFYREPLTDAVTDATFRRMCERADGMLALVAENDEGALVGFAHIVIHPSTWSATSYCYLEDLFVARAGRGADVARRLIEAVYDVAREAGSTRVYWHTQQFNGAARSLYDTVAQNTSHVVYEWYPAE